MAKKLLIASLDCDAVAISADGVYTLSAGVDAALPIQTWSSMQAATADIRAGDVPAGSQAEKPPVGGEKLISKNTSTISTTPPPKPYLGPTRTNASMRARVMLALVLVAVLLHSTSRADNFDAHLSSRSLQAAYGLNYEEARELLTVSSEAELRQRLKAEGSMRGMPLPRQGIPEGVDCLKTEWWVGGTSAWALHADPGRHADSSQCRCDHTNVCTEICERGSVKISPWQDWAMSYQVRPLRYRVGLCFCTGSISLTYTLLGAAVEDATQAAALLQPGACLAQLGHQPGRWLW